MFINHINFSGMKLGKEQILELLDMFKYCKFLLAFHLNDNNICAKDFDECPEFFK